MQTGDSDEKSGKIALQPVDVFQQIKKTNGHAKRNILARQAEMVTEMSTDAATKRKLPESAKVADPAPVKHPKTKAQMLGNQVASLEELKNIFSQVSEGQKDLLKHRSDMMRLQKLEKALFLNLISQEEFTKAAKELLL